MVTLSKRVSIFSDGSILSSSNQSTSSVRKDVGLIVPSDGKYVQIRHDWEVLQERAPRQYQSYPVEKYAFPAIVNKNWGLITKYQDREYDYVDMPDDWQWLLWEVWKWSVDNKIPIGKIESYYQKPNNERVFAKTTEGSLTWYYVNMVEAHRAFTEAYSPEGGARDVVTGRNLSSKPYKWLFRTTTGNICKVIGETASHWILEALDVSKSAPSLDYILTHKPHLIHWATEVGSTKLPDGRYPVSNFPQAEVVSKLHGLPYYGTPIPFLSLGGSVMIAKRSTRILESGKPYSPYVKEL